MFSATASSDDETGSEEDAQVARFRESAVDIAFPNSPLKAQTILLETWKGCFFEALSKRGELVEYAKAKVDAGGEVGEVFDDIPEGLTVSKEMLLEKFKENVAAKQARVQALDAYKRKLQDERMQKVLHKRSKKKFKKGTTVAQKGKIASGPVVALPQVPTGGIAKVMASTGYFGMLFDMVLGPGCDTA